MKLFGHLKTVCRHKYWVGYFCFKFGLYYQGIVHDLSKFNPVEFFESVKYYTGTYSPIDACKKDIGYSNAWFHHKGRNKHHFEYWLDDFEKGCIPKKMPLKYVLEMFCDWLGAGISYSGGMKNFKVKTEYNWWLNKRKVAPLHKDVLATLDLLFDLFAKYDGNVDKIVKNDLDLVRKIYKNGDYQPRTDIVFEN